MDTISQTGGAVSIGARPGRDGRDGRGIAQIEQPDSPSTAIVRLTDGVGLPLALPLGPPGGRGDKGDRGDAGLQPWRTPPQPWLPAAGYSASAPADCVTINGSSYVCAVSHTSGAAFDPTKWTLIAQKGDTGAQGNASTVPGPQGLQGAQGNPGPAGNGSGNVVAPASAVSGNFAAYADSTGTVLTDSGVSARSLADDAFVNAFIFGA